MRENSSSNSFPEKVTLFHTQHQRLLIVDDESAIRSSLASLLKVNYSDFEIITASSAEEALSYFETSEVDIIVTDFRLPQMDGLELTRLLQQISPKTCPILMTAYGNSTVVQRAKRNGCSGYLQKPLDIDLLFSYIDKVRTAQLEPQAEGQLPEESNKLPALDLAFTDPDCSIADLILSFKKEKLVPGRGPSEKELRLGKRQIPELPTWKPSPAFGVALRQRTSVEKQRSSTTTTEFPREVHQLVNLGVERFKAKRLFDAEQLWRKALEIDPNCTQAQENLKVLGRLRKNWVIN